MSNASADQASAHAWNFRDVAYVSIVVLPPLMAVSLVIASFVSWQSYAAQADRALLQVFPDAQDTRRITFANWYDKKASKQQTLPWKRVMSAADAISNELDRAIAPMSGQIKLTPPDQPFPEKDYVRRIAEQFRPILQQLEPLGESREAVWLPFVFGDSAARARASFNGSIAYLLRYEFLDAFHQGDNERAIHAIRLLSRDRKNALGNLYFFLWIGQHLIRDSLQYDVWTEEDIKTLQQLVSTESDWDAHWRNMTQAELLQVLPWLTDKQRTERLSRYRSSHANTRLVSNQALSSTVAPSEVKEVFESFAALEAIPHAGTKAHAEAAAMIYDFPRGQPDDMVPADVTLDQWLKIPFMRGTWHREIVARASSNSGYLAQNAVGQRWTRTAVAIKQFRMRFDRFPMTSSELVEVGLPLSATLDYTGKPLRYRLVDDGNLARLWNHASEPPAQENTTVNGVWSQSVDIK